MNDYPAIIWGTRSISRQRLEQYISSVVKQLKGRGIGSKDRLAIIEPNSVEYVIILLALWRMGVVVCPLNPQWSYETLAQCCGLLNPRAILTSQTPLLSSKKLTIPVIQLRELISYDARQSTEAVAQEIPLAQEATIIWTSGSSSQPKAAVHTWGNHVYSAKGSQEVIPLKAGDRWVLSLPLYHVSGISIVCRCVLARTAMVIAQDEDLAAVIYQTKPTHISLVATQLYRLLEHKDNQVLLRSLKYILLGGSAIPRPLLEKALSLQLPVYVSYGLTEMSSQVATGKVEAPDQPCAKLLPYRQLKIDTNGQMLVKGEVLFKGYLHQNKIFLPLTKDGWFKTGDLGKLEQGRLSVLGRLDNMFICAGENIQPEEIENVFLRLPQVKEAIVVGKKDAEYGARPVVFIRCEGNFDRQFFKTHCAGHLPKIKVPVAFYPWPKELVTQGIKISRKDFLTRI
ncbi:MAG: o-succinylbenzoate--CoA ligase [Candidatus Omnitrophica bacterium]|nr:o-succinylbenzoate--CoA ligase [Candidatus Omnitrophota bacterium]